MEKSLDNVGNFLGLRAEILNSIKVIASLINREVFREEEIRREIKKNSYSITKPGCILNKQSGRSSMSIAITQPGLATFEI